MTYSFTKFASNAALFSSRIPPESMFSTETRTQRALLKRIVDLQNSDFTNRIMESLSSNLNNSNKGIMSHLIIDIFKNTKYSEKRRRRNTYCNFFIKEVFESQHQASNHFSEKQCIYAPLKNYTKAANKKIKVKNACLELKPKIKRNDQFRVL